MSLTITLQRTAYTANDSINAEAFNNQSALSASIADGGSYLFGLGALGSPSVGFIGDADTGMYSPGADQLALVCGGVARLMVSAAGTVTIPGTITASGGITGNVIGTLMAPLGAVGTPSLTFSGDTNTGLFSPGADQLALVTAGVARLTVSAAGAVTIPGALTASGGLTGNVTGNVTGSVAGTLTAPLGAVGTPSVAFAGDADTGLYSPGADQLALVTGGVARLTVSAAGDVAIAGVLRATGAAFISDLSNSGKYVDFGNAFARAYTLSICSPYTATSNALYFGLTYDGTDARYEHVIGSGSAYGALMAFNGSTGGLNFGISAAANANGEAATVNTRMTLWSTGALRLHAYGAGTLVTDASGNVTASNALTGTLTAPLGAVGTPSIRFSGDTDTGLYSPGADQLALVTGGVARLTVSAAGAIATPGTLTVNSGASPAGNVRNITISTAAPSGGADGDVWLQYTA